MMQLPKLFLMLLLSSVLLLPGCIHSGGFKAERSAKARLILKADKVLILSNDYIPLYIGHFMTGPDFNEGQRIMDLYKIASPLSGVINNFLQSLPPEVVAGEVVNQDTPNIDLQQFSGWVEFFPSFLYLEDIPFTVGYRLHYRVVVKILDRSYMVNKKGQMFMYNLWQAECHEIKPGTHPLRVWLENDAAMLKEKIPDFQVSCGQQLSKDLVRFLEISTVRK